MRRSPFKDQREWFRAGSFGMWLFLASLGMLFGATIIAYLVLRLEAARAETTTETPPLPLGLWFSTAVLLLSSVTMQRALLSARNDRPDAIARSMVATTALGVLFLLVQTVCWLQWIAPFREEMQAIAAANSGDVPAHAYLITSFYVMTSIHALHVIGGLIPLVIVTRRAQNRAYTADQHAGVKYCAMYWHFLDGVWLVLFATLLIGS